MAVQLAGEQSLWQALVDHDHRLDLADLRSSQDSLVRVGLHSVDRLNLATMISDNVVLLFLQNF